MLWPLLLIERIWKIPEVQRFHPDNESNSRRQLRQPKTCPDNAISPLISTAQLQALKTVMPRHPEREREIETESEREREREGKKEKSENLGEQIPFQGKLIR